ncbi:Expansin-A20-like protein [Drosera capensis]
MGVRLQATAMCLILLSSCLLVVVWAGDDDDDWGFSDEEWRSATATFTKETNDSITTEGACGYGNFHKTSYGEFSAGLSTALFNKGSTCGGCFKVRCVDHILYCLSGSPSIVVTATDFCPPNYGLSTEYGGRCNFPQEHIELSEAAFVEIAERRAEIVPVQYRRLPDRPGAMCRVSCYRRGGVRFTLTGNGNYLQVLITNVGSDGEVVGVKIKGTKTGWMPLARNWGQYWQGCIDLKGQPLSFEVVASSGALLTTYNVAPANWQFGQTYEGKQF